VRYLARRPALRWAAPIGAGAIAVLLMPVPARAQGELTSFSGSSDGFGVNLTVTVPGAPITNTPVDSGGPTAQADLTSFGTSEGYAAFPDPGQTVISLPGLAEGLLGTGLAGLPPVSLPQLPSYPFFVQSEAGSEPSDQLGAGPYKLSATSNATASDASANGGLQDGLTGDAALITSDASVAGQSDGTVVAQATSEIQGLTVGPLTIGEVLSTATETASADGTLTPSTNLVMSGVQVGGLPLSLSSAGLDLLGPSVPLPLNSTLGPLLTRYGLTATVVAAQNYKGEVVAPAVELTGPVNDLGLGTGEGTFTLTLGGAEAAMQVGVAPPSAPPASGHTSTPASPSVSPVATTVPSGSTGSAATSVATTPAAASVSPGTTAVAAVAGAASTPATEPDDLVRSSAPAPTPRSLAVVSDPLGFDIRSVYLVFAGAAIVALLAAQLVRTLGVRGPWTSSSG
jgi:hypothetical protein